MNTPGPGFAPPDYLDTYASQLPHDDIQALRDERAPRIWDRRLAAVREAVLSVGDIRSEWWELTGDVLQVGRRSELSDDQAQRWEQSLRAFCPWKKGPFRLFDTTIDAEWRSDWKWNRIAPHIKPLAGHKVADVGCHNGYFMFRMTAHQPELVIGLEPFARHLWNFQLVQNIVRHEALFFELLGVEHIDRYPHFFDTIFCLGILYHHTDPVGLLRKLRSAMAPQAQIVIDCQGIAGDSPVALTPRGRYANARGIWFLPTRSCLEHWMARAGFVNLRCIFHEPLSPAEQRRTPWADIDSLRSFLDPDDPSLTIEGYPAPWRTYIVADRG